MESIRAILKIQGGWIRCPRCGYKLKRILPTTMGRDIPVPCRRCKIEWITDIRVP